MRLLRNRKKKKSDLSGMAFFSVIPACFCKGEGMRKKRMLFLVLAVMLGVSACQASDERSADSALTAPVLTGLSVDADGILVQWEPVQGAAGYALLRQTSGDDWEQIGMTEETAYTDQEGPFDGTTYTYTVRAYTDSPEDWGEADPKGLTGSAYAIEGTSTVEVEQMVDFYNRTSPIDYPSDALSAGGAASIEDLAACYLTECQAEGIKVEVAFCQMILETGYLAYGGDVSITQYNFAGLGATGNGASGASFSSVEEGVRAQVQHLKAYASPTVTQADLAHDLVDPRFEYVTKGSAKFVEILGAGANPTGHGWAVGETSDVYGAHILELIRELKG